MKLVDRIFAWALVALGLVHCALTPLARAAWTIDTIWFLCGGLAMVFAGMLNLLRVAYSGVAPATRLAALLANVLMLSVTVGLGSLLPLRGNPQVVIVGILLLVELVLSAARQDVVAPS